MMGTTVGGLPPEKPSLPWLPVTTMQPLRRPPSTLTMSPANAKAPLAEEFEKDGKGCVCKGCEAAGRTNELWSLHTLAAPQRKFHEIGARSFDWGAL